LRELHGLGLKGMATGRYLRDQGLIPDLGKPRLAKINLLKKKNKFNTLRKSNLCFCFFFNGANKTL